MSPVSALLQDEFGGVEPDTPIYRIIDFFTFARMVEEQTLFVSRATAFTDENEGIDAILGGLVSKAGLFRDGQGVVWKDHEEALRHHQALRQTHYVTCWTKLVESVALWSLYSEDHCSVSVQTSARKLRQALDAAWDVEGKQKILAATPDQTLSAICDVNFGPVQYHSLSKLHARIGRFGRALDRLDKRLVRTGELLIERWSQALNKDRQGRSAAILIELILRPFFTKDESYAHESEIRGTLRIGTASLDAKGIETARNMFAQNSRAVDKLFSSFFKPPPEEACPKAMLVKIPRDFIDAVRIDPRCPAYKAEFIETFANRNKVPVHGATSFGYLPRHVRLEYYAGAKLRDAKD